MDQTEFDNLEANQIPQKSQFLSDILNCTIQQLNVNINTEANSMNSLSKRNSSIANNNSNQNYQFLEEKLSQTIHTSNLHKISLDEALAEAEKLLKKNYLLENRKDKLENEKMVQISMIGSRNLQLKHREELIRSIDSQNNEIHRTNLKLQAQLIASNKNVDLLQNQLKLKEMEISQLKTLCGSITDISISMKPELSKNNTSSDKNENEPTFLEKLLQQEKSFLQKLAPIDSQIGSINPMSPNTKAVNIKLNPIETSIAEQVLASNLKKIQEMTKNESTLHKIIEELEASLEKNHLESETRYSSLQNKLNATVKDLVSIKESKIEEENPDVYNKEQISAMIRNFKKLKSQNLVLKDNLKRYASEWTRDLEQSSSQYIEVVNLKKSYENLQQDYKDLNKKVAQESDSKLDEKIKSREDIILAQASQIQNILWENHKLREYILKKLNIALNPINFKFFKVENCLNQQEIDKYTLIGEQSEQISKLRQKIYVMTSSEKMRVDEEEGEERDTLIDNVARNQTGDKT